MPRKSSSRVESRARARRKIALARASNRASQDPGEFVSVELRPLGELIERQAPTLPQIFSVRAKALAGSRPLGVNLRHLRKRRGYSQEALAFRADIHRTEVGLLERGKRDAGFNVIVKLAGALQVDPGEFFSGTTFLPSEGSHEPHFAYDSPEAES